MMSLISLPELFDESDCETGKPFTLTKAEESERADTTHSNSDDQVPLEVVKQRKTKRNKNERRSAKDKNELNSNGDQDNKEEEVQSSDDTPVVSTKRPRVALYNSDSAQIMLLCIY